MKQSQINNPVIDQHYQRIRLQYSLTKKETEVLKILTFHGKSNRQLGSTLNVTEKTMKNHIANINEKTNTHSSRELQALIFREILFPVLVETVSTKNNDSNEVMELRNSLYETYNVDPLENLGNSLTMNSDVNEFVNCLELPEEVILKKFNLTLEGNSLTPEEARQFIDFVRRERKQLKQYH